MIPETTTSVQKKTAAVHISTLALTGGSGFLGQAILRELTGPDAIITTDSIRILDLASPGFRKDPRISHIKGDIRDPEAVDKLINGADAVIHTAAIVDWGNHPRETVMDVNVNGTRQIIEGCIRNGASVMVNVSSLDAISRPKPVRNGDESLPYPKKHPNAYCESKAEAEKLIRAVDPAQLRAATIRPTGIFGEADPYHITSLMNMAIKGPYVRIGNGKSLCQHVYVGNVAHAVLGACSALYSGNETVAGREYFITDSPPKNFFGYLDTIVEASGYTIKPKNLRLPKVPMWFFGLCAEFFAMLIRPVKKITPTLTRFAVNYTCNDFTLSGERAARDFGFVPKYPEDEAFRRTVDWFREHGPVPSRELEL